MVCYVSKVDVQSNFIEICDTKYSVKCSFEDAKALSSLKDFVTRQPLDINILGLLGKQVRLNNATLNYHTHRKDT